MIIETGFLISLMALKMARRGVLRVVWWDEVFSGKLGWSPGLFCNCSIEQLFNFIFARLSNQAFHFYTVFDQHQRRPSGDFATSGDFVSFVGIPVNKNKSDDFVVFWFAPTELIEHATLTCTGSSPGRFIKEEGGFTIRHSRFDNAGVVIRPTLYRFNRT